MYAYHQCLSILHHNMPSGRHKLSGGVKNEYISLLHGENLLGEIINTEIENTEVSLDTTKEWFRNRC